MEGDISDMYAKLNLTETESEAINLEDVIDETIDQKANLSLVGKLLTKKPYNLNHMKNALTSAWRLAKGFNMKEIGDNLFVCEFKSKTDKSRILNEAPWHFDKQVIIFEPLSGNLQPGEVGLDLCPFWIRIYNLPLNCRGKAAIAKIGGKVGRIVEWSEEEMTTWGRYSRVRVMVDISKPIVRGTKIINPLGESCWVYFKYEKIQNFCYWCGFLDHTVADCEDKPEEMDVEDWPYSPVLRATPKKRGLMGERYGNSQGDGGRRSRVNSMGHDTDESHVRETTVRRELQMEVQGGDECDIQSGKITDRAKTGPAAKESNNIDIEGGQDNFIEVQVAQVKDTTQIIADGNGVIDKQTLSGKPVKKSLWSRIKPQRKVGKEKAVVAKKGSVKRGADDLQCEFSPSNLFSKKVRDGLLDQFNNFEISAETAGQSRRMQ